MKQETLVFQTHGRGTMNITRDIQQVVAASGVVTGLAHLFVQHTSASLMLCENADPAVRQDLETFMCRIAPDGVQHYVHADEGPDDMPAHIRSLLTGMDLSIPVAKGRCLLGTWQGIFLWEHRTHAHHRRITITVFGEYSLRQSDGGC